MRAFTGGPADLHASPGGRQLVGDLVGGLDRPASRQHADPLPSEAAQPWSRQPTSPTGSKRDRRGPRLGAGRATAPRRRSSRRRGRQPPPGCRCPSGTARGSRLGSGLPSDACAEPGGQCGVLADQVEQRAHDRAGGYVQVARQVPERVPVALLDVDRVPGRRGSRRPPGRPRGRLARRVRSGWRRRGLLCAGRPPAPCWRWPRRGRRLRGGCRSGAARRVRDGPPDACGQVRGRSARRAHAAASPRSSVSTSP